MPDVKEVYEMVTQQTPPKPDALERQRRRQLRATRNKKLGAFAVAAAIAVAGAVFVLTNRPEGSGGTTPATRPSISPTAPGTSGTVGTVTFDGSSCSMEITADRIEPGSVTFEVVNTTDERAMFDSWRLLDGYTVREFEAVIERDRRIFESGKPGGVFPDQETEVEFLSSEVVPANGSSVLVSSMVSGPHAIVCLQPLGRPSPFGVVGPIVVR